MRRPFHKVMTFFLSAAVLMGSMVPSPITHIHADGDRTHSHESDVDEFCGERDHKHGGDHAHAHVDWHRKQLKDSHECSENELEHHVAHKHFWFFGIDFSIPLSECHGSGDPSTWQDYGIPGIARLNDDVSSVLRVDRVDPLDMELGLSNYLDPIDAKMTDTAKSVVQTIGRKLLSDNARSEWFRVLQI